MNTTLALDFETRIDIPELTRESMVGLLNQQLADTFDVYTQIKQAHWNVKGMCFMPLHLFLDDLASNFIRYEDMMNCRSN